MNTWQRIRNSVGDQSGRTPCGNLNAGFKYCSLHGILVFLILWIFSVTGVFAQNSKVRRIELIHADEFYYASGKKAKRLIGHVQLKHDSALLFCDSAHLYKESNSMEAFGHVVMKQGDTLQLNGDSLFYSGNERLAQMRGEITLKSTDATLTCRFLDYDRNNGFASYYGGGELVNKKENNTLTSEKGYYYPRSKQFYFKDNVQLINADYEIYSDTLQYDSPHDITYFFGPSVIRSKKNTIYCENGWYNTAENTAQFSRNAWITTEDQKVSGDSIHYDRNQGIGKVYGHAVIQDTSSALLLKGDYAFSNDKDSSSLITGRALFIQYENKDSLFLHADTLKMRRDSSGSRVMHAAKHVKFFREDMQGQSDSLVFTENDSTITMFGNPLLWNGKNQLSSDTVIIITAKGTIYRMNMRHNAFISTLDDSIYFDQIKGKNMIGHFKDGELQRIDVMGNGQTVYFPMENDTEYLGVNRADCSNMIIAIDTNRKVSNITFLNEPSATLYPISQAPKDELQLPGFVWRGEERPVVAEDVFYWGAVPVREKPEVKVLKEKPENPDTTKDIKQDQAPKGERPGAKDHGKSNKR